MQVLIGNSPQCSECLSLLTQTSVNLKEGYVVFHCGKICTSFLCPHTNPKDCKFSCKNFGINLEVPYTRLEVKQHEGERMEPE
jgi:hypothetical protein